MFTHGVVSRRTLAPILLVSVFLTMACWEAPAQSSGSLAGEEGRTQSRKATVAKGTPQAKPAAVDEGKTENAPTQEIELLKQLVAEQQQQIEQLRVAMEEQKQMIQEALNGKPTQQAMAPNIGEVASNSPVVPSSSGELIASAGGFPGSPSPAIQGGGQDHEVEIMKGELEAVAESAAQANQRLAKVEKDVKDADKEIADRVKGLGNFTFGGDVRVRYENFFSDTTQTRNRQRFRARISIKGKLSDSISGEFGLASGDLSDPISTNQSQTTYFTRKPLGIDLAYLTINPAGFRPLKIVAGKQKYPWYRTQLTFDNDMNPEGFSEAISFKTKSFVKNVSLVGFQMPFNESGGGKDSFMYGGQFQMDFAAGEKGKFGIYASGLKFSRPNPIAVAQGAGSIGGNALTNTVIRNASNVVTGYAGEFLYFNAGLKTGYKFTDRWPLDIGFDFVSNTQAATSERAGYLAEIFLGKQGTPKDVKFGYQFYRVEKDAVISAFNFSDLRQGTDVQEHVVFFGYQIIRNVTGEWTYLIGKRIGDSSDPWLNRMQFDLVYKF